MPERSGMLFRFWARTSRSSVALLIFFTCSNAVLVGSGSIVELNLSNGTVSGDIWVTDSQVALPSSDELVVRVTDFPVSGGFSVIHIHSFPPLSNVAVEHNGTTMNGSDLGFVHLAALGPTVFTLKNPLPWTVQIMIVIRTHNEFYPIPGGCAMEFPTKVAPYLIVQRGNETIAVKGQKGAETVNDHLCLNNDLEYEFYYTYTSELIEDAQDHFARLRSMLNYSEIVERAYQARWMGGSPTQRLFAKYPGVCTYYAMAVKSPLGQVSLYSPSSSMLCRLEEASYLSLGTKALIATLLPIGTILCFGGHSVLPTSIFFTTCLAGHQLSYVGFTESGFTPQDAYSWGILVAVVVAGLVIFFLLACTFPIVWLIIPYIAAGYLFDVALYYLFAGNLVQFSSGPSYWIILIVVVVGLAGILIFLPTFGLTSSFSMIGGFLISCVISHIMDTRFHYLAINPIRRLTVEGFDTAITSPPLETADIIVFVLWIALTVSGFEKQRRRARGKAPFPPPPRLSFFSRVSEERSPLLQDSPRPYLGHT